MLFRVDVTGYGVGLDLGLRGVLHGRPQDFFQGWAKGKLGGMEAKVPAGSWGGVLVGAWGQSPQKPTKNRENDA